MISTRSESAISARMTCSMSTMVTPRSRMLVSNTINSSMVPGGIDDHFIAHHLAKAKGGAAWIGSETWLLNSPFPPETPDEIGLSVGFASHFPIWQNPPFAEGMAKFYGELHKVGAVAIAQLTHLSAVWAPSSVPAVGAQDYVPHVMGEDEIEFHFESYAQAAEAAQRFGADAIEMHCAHETLGYTFLSPVTNRRSTRLGSFHHSSRTGFLISGGCTFPLPSWCSSARPMLST